jgi:N6-adenosine-specific RNA methylase IME4/ParB-like chromosome segregation protein Spo0J
MTDYDLHDLCKLFPPMPEDQFNSLIDSIRDHGLLTPIMLHEGKILDGRHRYKACINLGIEPSFEEYEGEDALGYVIALNLSRRHLDESQRAMIAGRLSTLKHGESKSTRSKGSIEPSAALTRVEAGQKLNVGKESVKRARKVLEHGTTELAQAVDAGQITVSVAAKISELDHKQQAQVMADPKPEQAIKKIARQEKEQELAERTIIQTMHSEGKLYGVIYSDPPWKYETFSENGMDRSADNHYPTMSMFEMMTLDVPAADDCVLFMWATVPMLPEALDLLHEWGFNYKSHICWIKDRQGTGYWTRNKHELLLIATKGKVPAPAMGTQPPSVIELPLGRHSEKPAFFADMISTLYPTTPKLEMFARIGRVGWDVIGNEAPDGEET